LADKPKFQRPASADLIDARGATGRIAWVAPNFSDSSRKPARPSAIALNYTM